MEAANTKDKGADRIYGMLREYSMEGLKALFGANDEITKLNYQRYQSMELRRGGAVSVGDAGKTSDWVFTKGSAE